jgi:quercetin dioxygenase-like cupin family protein
MSGGVGLYLPARTGPTFWGPGDRYTFLVTGEQSGGRYFAMEAFVPPGGGPPPHVHEREDETFYILEGTCGFRIEDRRFTAGPGDFVSVPRGLVHNFSNDGDTISRIILTFTPAGIDKFFLETLEVATDPNAMPPDNMDQVVARYIEAAPRYGIRFV